jgi:plasmid stabilization system protein ParE
MLEIGYKYQNKDLLYGHYRIAYFIKDKNTIDILGVFHGSFDIQRDLKI